MTTPPTDEELGKLEKELPIADSFRLIGIARSLITEIRRLRALVPHSKSQLKRLEAMGAPLSPEAAFEHAWTMAFKDSVRHCGNKADAKFWFLGGAKWQSRQIAETKSDSTHNPVNVPPGLQEETPRTYSDGSPRPSKMAEGAAIQINELLSAAVVKNTGITNGYFSGVSIDRIAFIIDDCLSALRSQVMPGIPKQ